MDEREDQGSAGEVGPRPRGEAVNEMLSGARYTFGALVVLTLWSIGAVQFYEYRIESAMAETVEVQEAHEALTLDADSKFLMEHGYPRGSSMEDRQRHLIRAQETPL